MGVSKTESSVKNNKCSTIKKYNSSVEFAKQLRKDATDAEKLLWRYLRSRSLENVKFRRQQPFGTHIVDFISTEKKLVIELDGGQHATNKAHDLDRDQYIESEGYKVLRFWNNDVLQKTEGVLERIRIEILKDAPSP